MKSTTLNNFCLEATFNCLDTLHDLLGNKYEISVRFDRDTPYYVINEEEYPLGTKVKFDSTSGIVYIGNNNLIKLSH